MSQYIHLSTEPGNADSLQQVKAYFVGAIKDKDKKEAEEFDTEFQDNYVDGCDFHVILNLFFKHIKVITDLPHEKNREIEGCFSLMISLLQFLDSEEKAAQMTEELSKILVSEKNHPNLRLKLLMCLYNLFPPHIPVRYPIFEKIIKFAFDTGLYDQLIPYLNQLEDWKLDWNLTAEQEMSLYYTIQNQLRDLNRREQAYDYLQRYLGIFEGAPETYLEDKTTEEGAMQVMKDALALPKVFEVDSVLSLAAVRHLGRKHPKFMELMDIFCRAAKPGELIKFHKANQKVFSEYKIDFELLLEKLRLLSLASFAEQKQEIALADAAKELGEPVEEIEKWVVKAIAEGVVEGRIDQLIKTVKIKSTLHRTFGQKEWAHLETQINKWIENIQVLRTLVAKRSGSSELGDIAASCVELAH